MKRRVADGLSLVAHALLVAVIATCPRRASPRLRLNSVDPASPRPAAPRIVFLMPRPTRPNPSVSSPRLGTRSRANASAKVSGSPATISGDSTSHLLADTVSTVSGPPVTLPVDSGPPKVVEYERPVHPALRGLVPMWNGGKIWRGMVSPISLVPGLRARPPDCFQGTPGYFSCADRVRRWRDDSIYHVSVRCQPDPRRVGQLFPPDCGRFRSDSVPD